MREQRVFLCEYNISESLKFSVSRADDDFNGRERSAEVKM